MASEVCNMKKINIVNNFMGENSLEELDNHLGSVMFPWYLQREDNPFEDRCDMFHTVYTNDTWVCDNPTKHAMSYLINMINPIAFLNIRVQNYCTKVDHSMSFTAWDENMLVRNDTTATALFMMDKSHEGELIVQSPDGDVPIPIKKNTLIVMDSLAKYRVKITDPTLVCRMIKFVYVGESINARK